MVAATQQQQQQATATAPSAEEEALKRNTDCVYFLASPLTCKKGGECEYRHSEYARVNPRDCYYWLNGNCLNPKCGFRHPPLDGLFGNQVTTPAVSSMPKPQTAAGPAMHQHPAQTPVKQSVPCVFFQKGLCLKGDRCAFLHGPNPASDKVSHPVAPSSSTKLPTQPKVYTGPQKLTQDQNIPQASFSKAAEVSAVAKTVPKPEITSKRNGVGVEKNLPPSKSTINEAPKYKATIPHPAVNGTSSRFNRMHQSQVPDNQILQNGKDADEFLRESSPGFDVLVDDELRNSDFYHGEDQYGRTDGHEGRNLNSVDEYDRGHSVDYNSVSDIDRETYHDLRGYDSYERMQGQYGWDQHRPSSDRMPLGPAHLDRRGYLKADSPEHNDDPDLRYRLSKHRRVNGLRSVVNKDYVHDNQVEDRGYRSSSRRDSHNVSTRLQGRIKLPGRSSSSSDLRVEREIDRGRNRARLSPGRSQMSSHQGRLRDRIKGRMGEDYDSEGRSVRDNRTRRELTDDGNSDFTGPKSLAELKGTKGTERATQPSSLRKRKHLEDHQPSQVDLSFDGPMPLSEILKRKREAEASGSSRGTSSSNKHDFNKGENKKVLLGNANNAAVTMIESDKDKESKFATVGENTEVYLDQYSSQIPNPDEPEADYGMEEYQEYEGDDQREGDYEYDQGDEGEYYEEGEHVEGEEEYVEEEGEVDGDGSGDGDDFAKKIGVMLS